MAKKDMQRWLPMPKIIRDGSIVDDQWMFAGSDETAPIPSAADAPFLIVPLKVWQSARQALLARGGGLGLLLETSDEPALVGADVSLFGVIAINFAKFTDGRGYSLGRLLRERYQYGGELRAIGDVLKDQLFYLKRSGFNAFAIRADKSIDAALKSLSDFSESYQGAWDQPLPLFKRRQVSTVN
jgi:uncharacterized protein (DUF934 family)